VFSRQFLQRFLPNRSKIPNYFLVIGIIIFTFLFGFHKKRYFSEEEKRLNWHKRIYRISEYAIHKAPIENYRNYLASIQNQTSIPRSLILSILVVENYGRPPLRRWVEKIIAQSKLLLTGKIPNFSLGIGQITPKTARMVLDSTENNTIMKEDREIFKVLLEPRENIKILVEYLNHLIREQRIKELNKTTINSIIRIFNGQNSSSFENEFYLQVVWHIYYRIKNIQESTFEYDTPQITTNKSSLNEFTNTSKDEDEIRKLLGITRTTPKTIELFNKQNIIDLLDKYNIENHLKNLIQNSSNNVDQTKKKTISNFLEYLRTAFHLKDVEFIKRCIADDAIIIIDNTADVETNAIIRKNEFVGFLKVLFIEESQIYLNFDIRKFESYKGQNTLIGVSLKQYSIISKRESLFLLIDIKDVFFPKICMLLRQKQDLQLSIPTNYR